MRIVDLQQELDWKQLEICNKPDKLDGPSFIRYNSEIHLIKGRMLEIDKMLELLETQLEMNDNHGQSSSNEILSRIRADLRDETNPYTGKKNSDEGSD
jgi:hypothetical protein